jgi:hypothetical protein
MSAHLEIQLLLEDSVQKLPILARICLIDSVVSTHDTADTGLDGLGERPQLVFVESAIVDVG